MLWLLEISPALIGVGLCIILYPRLKFSRTTYAWCFIAAGIMAVGAHYSYSEVPLFLSIQDVLNSSRNNFDKVGHFVQGIIPVLITMEVMLQRRLMQSARLINFLSLCVALAVAASYEMIEWLAIAFSSDVTENFLGMQGYIWDSQSDMFLALLGALCTLLFWKSLHGVMAPAQA